MALTLQIGPGKYPRYISSGTPTFANMTIDAAEEKAGYVFIVPRTGTISKIGILISGVTVNAASRLYAGLRTVVSGDPSTTNYGGSADYVDSAAPTTGWKWYTLATGASATKGDAASVVVGYNVFTAADTVGIRYIGSGFALPFSANAYGDAYIGTPSWAKQDGYVCNMTLEYSDGVIEQVQGCAPFSAYTTLILNNTSNPNHIALRFRLTSPRRLRGVDISMNLGDDAYVKFFGSDGFTNPSGGTITVESDNKSASGSMRNYSIEFPTPIDLLANTWYRVAFLPASATNSSVSYFDVTDDGANPAMNAMDGGVDMHWSTSNGAPTAEASWTQTLTRRPLISLLFDKFDDGAGGGAGGVSRGRLLNSGGF